ncbi:raffinose invertase [Manduca sexta]|uniref:raffinose invertase n=1 Tax=Manduca sexta TaxID=7130 RepID=UPI00188F6B14|nr:raffinose invertase [Manduca sexta]
MRTKMYIKTATFLLCVFLGSVSSCCVNGRYYPRYHLSPPHGWMNDPNGFCYFKGEYHMFYQYNPMSSLDAGIAHWGHAKSKDLCHWKHLDLAIYPDQWYDQTGAFSGSALVENDVMYIYYTGNVNLTDEMPFEGQFQALGVSTDGVYVEKYKDNPIMYTPNHQPHIRDPKVWEHDGSYYMVLGNAYDDYTNGQIVMYESSDKINWQEVTILYKSNGSFGYMWECPDLFEIDGKFVLLFSPQGVKSVGDMYQNLYQAGYIVGEFNYDTHSFTVLTEFRELDHGHDFYATQTMKDPSGRRIVVAWASTWEYAYPERADGWAGMLTLPRTLSLTKDLKLIQTPIREIDQVFRRRLYSGKASAGKTVALPDKAGKVELKWDTPRNIKVVIESQNECQNVVISYDHEDGTITLDRGGDDAIRRTHWDPRGHLKWTIFIDASSIELSCGDGEVWFTSRFFPEGVVSVRLGEDTCVDKFTVHSIRRTTPDPEAHCRCESEE